MTATSLFESAAQTWCLGLAVSVTWSFSLKATVLGRAFGVPWSARPISHFSVGQDKIGHIWGADIPTLSKQQLFASRVSVSVVRLSRDSGNTPVVVDWAALDRRILTQDSIGLDVFGHDCQSAIVRPKATALAEGARRKMGLGCS